MINVVVRKPCEAAAERVWALLSDFGNMSWVPGMGPVTVEGEGVGMVRKIAFENAPPAVERLDASDAETMRFVYSVLSGNPMPIDNLRGSVALSALEDGRCMIEWTAQADGSALGDLEASALLEKFYGRVIDTIGRHFASQRG